MTQAEVAAAIAKRSAAIANKRAQAKALADAQAAALIAQSVARRQARLEKTPAYQVQQLTNRVAAVTAQLQQLQVQLDALVATQAQLMAADRGLSEENMALTAQIVALRNVIQQLTASLR